MSLGLLVAAYLGLLPEFSSLGPPHEPKLLIAASFYLLFGLGLSSGIFSLGSPHEPRAFCRRLPRQASLF